MAMSHVRETVGTVDDVGKRLETAVKANQFGIIGVVDLQAKMKEKGVEFANACRIYEVCNPQRAKQVLEKDMNLSTVLPCRITVYEVGGKTFLATLKPTALLAMFNAPQLDEVARQVEDALVKIMKEVDPQG